TPSGGTPVLSTDFDVVTVNTNNSAGYTLTLENSDATTALTDDVTSDTIPAHNGTIGSPSALAANTWDFAVANEGGFGTTYTAQENTSTDTMTFACVPLTASAATSANTSGTATGEQTTVWYGVRVDSSQPTGSDDDEVTYTATTNY